VTGPTGLTGATGAASTVTGPTGGTGGIGSTGPTGPAFSDGLGSVSLKTTVTGASGSWVVVPFDNIVSDDSPAAFDVTTNKGRFTAPIAGYYLFTGIICMKVSAASGAYDLYAAITTANSSSVVDFRLGSTAEPSGDLDYAFVTVSKIVKMAANEYRYFLAQGNASGYTQVSGTSASPWYTHMSVHRVY
jgi:hypothetical protein